jgi:hypothetical protein
MITLFACPKPFTDPHIALIQRNAIASWLALSPRPTVILFGSEPGVAEVSREFGVIHRPTVARNAWGTPLVSDIFRQAEALAPDHVLCYANSDIILMDDFREAIQICKRRGQPWLMGGRPWDLPVLDVLKFESGWQERLASEAHRRKALRNVWACDYFAFTKGLWPDLPPFAIGRCHFDPALLYLAREQGAALIDATRFVTAVHQSHSYAAHLSGNNYMNNSEAQENFRLAGGRTRMYNWHAATHRVTGRRVSRSWTGTIHPGIQVLHNRLWDPAVAFIRPFRHLIGLDRKTLLRLSARFTGSPK